MLAFIIDVMPYVVVAVVVVVARFGIHTYLESPATSTRAPEDAANADCLTEDWYVVDMGDGGAVYGLVDEVTVGGAPWLRVRHPHPREGFTGTSRYPLADVRAIDCATEDECREYARAGESDEQGEMVKLAHREPVGADKAN